MDYNAKKPAQNMFIIKTIFQVAEQWFYKMVVEAEIYPCWDLTDDKYVLESYCGENAWKAPRTILLAFAKHARNVIPLK